MASITKYAYLLMATLLVAAAVAPLSMNTAAAAKTRVECVGTPFSYNGGDTATHEVGHWLGIMATGGSTTFDCTDDSHPLEGQTVQVDQAMRLRVTVGEDISQPGVVKGKTVIGWGGELIDTGHTTMRGVVSGTAECDPSGICTLALEAKAKGSLGGNGGTVSLHEVVTYNLNTRTVENIQVQSIIANGMEILG